MKMRTFVLLAIPFLAIAITTQADPITNVIPDAARPLPLSAVRLTGGPLTRAALSTCGRAKSKFLSVTPETERRL